MNSHNKLINKYALGIDYGTESVRIILVRIDNGELIASSVYTYVDGVIDRQLPIREKVLLGPDWALQNPKDYLSALLVTIPAILKKTKINPKNIVGIGIDFTSCTIMPVKSDGTPLCFIDEYKRNPHSWVKLWKHHSAQPEADRINLIASERSEPFLSRYGGKISSEWLFPKALEILHDAPEIYRAADRIIEAGDWIVWQLTGMEMRSTCQAGYKAIWSKKEGFPDSSYFKAVHPDFENIVLEKIGSKFYPPGFKAGGLNRNWSLNTGLQEGTPVSVAIIDAHSAALGCGASSSGQMVICMGTSSCHILLSRVGKPVSGVCGVVEDGVVPGYFAYEAGQAAVGDIFNWYLTQGLFHSTSPRKNFKETMFKSLEEKASTLKAGENGLLALDWWNGNRTPLVNANLSGMILGYSLDTKPYEVYRALIESTAMGTLMIIESFEKSGIPVNKIYATGGVAEKSPLLMQIYSDVTGMEIAVVKGSQICALGAAILGSLSGETAPEMKREIMSRISSKEVILYQPDISSNEIYKELYSYYCKLYNYFGKENNYLMKRLKEIKMKMKEKNDE